MGRGKKDGNLLYGPASPPAYSDIPTRLKLPPQAYGPLKSAGIKSLDLELDSYYGEGTFHACQAYGRDDEVVYESSSPDNAADHIKQAVVFAEKALDQKYPEWRDEEEGYFGRVVIDVDQVKTDFQLRQRVTEEEEHLYQLEPEQGGLSRRDQLGNEIQVDLEKEAYQKLEEANVATVTVAFDGYGDSGTVERITYLDEKDKIIKEPPLFGKDQLADNIADYIWASLTDRFGGWYNNEGGRGEAIIDVAGRTAEVEFTNCYEEIEEKPFSIGLLDETEE